MLTLNKSALWAVILVIGIVTGFNLSYLAGMASLHTDMQKIKEQLNDPGFLSTAAGNSATDFESLSIRLGDLEARLNHFGEGLASTKPTGESSKPLLAETSPKQSKDNSEESGALASAREDDSATALFSELMARTGTSETFATTPGELRPQAQDVLQATAVLMERFMDSPLISQADITGSDCDHTGCSISVAFTDPRAAIEQEMHLMNWLASVDSACSFTLAPLDITEAVVDGTRQMKIECHSN